MGRELDELLKMARAQWDAMSPEEKDKMLRQQIEGVAKAEASWPKPKFKYINGVKVYDSYEDYCNG